MFRNFFVGHRGHANFPEKRRKARLSNRVTVGHGGGMTAILLERLLINTLLQQGEKRERPREQNRFNGFDNWSNR